jgi:hypothetical protein
MKLTEKELALALALAVVGYAFSSRTWLLYLSGINPLQGLIIYYVILYGCLYVLSRMDLVVFGFKIKDPLQTLGLMLITFAFFICVNWESPYVQLVTTGSLDGASPVFYQAEDGALWYAWSQALPQADIETLRILTFAVTPFVLTLVGGLLVSERVRLGW